MVEARGDGRTGRRLSLGMVGGGRGAFIGAVHRMAARLDDRADLVAGALASDPERARASGADLGLDPARSYASYEEMARAESARPDGIEAVIIVTPNHLHVPVAKAFIAAGIDIICDKPLSASLAEAEELAALVKASGIGFAITYNNTAYAMVREMREMVQGGKLGRLRIVRVDYVQDWLTRPIDAEGQKQAAWRTDPAQAGASACLADIGVHAFSLAQFVTGRIPEAVAADLTTFVPGRPLDDNAHVLLRYADGARGVLVASQVSPGNGNRLALRIYGEEGGIEWFAHEPEVIRYTPFGEPTRILTRGGPGLGTGAASVSRMPSEHPEGYIEGFANLYREAIDMIAARRSGRGLPQTLVPGIAEGLDGMRFVDAAVRSSAAGSAWTPIAR